MLGRCREKLGGSEYRVAYCSNLIELLETTGPVDLLITNSVMHHLPDPRALILDLAPLLAPDCIWLAGHEPSRRFLANPVCRREFLRYKREDRWLRLVSVDRYRRRLRQYLRSNDLPERYAAAEAKKLNLFVRRPPLSLIRTLVDYHVIHAPGEELARGLDHRQMERDLAGEWELLWVETYSFMGSMFEGYLSPRWRRVAAELERRFPESGANTCVIWRRASGEHGA
jgi:hypothetical protein